MRRPPSTEYDGRVRRLLTIVAGIAAAAAIVGIVIYGRSNSSLLTRHTASAIPVKSRKAAPALTGTALSGTPVSLNRYAGKPVIVNFFASWCAPCKAEAPGLAQLARRFRGRVQMLAVDNADNDSRAAARRFVAKYGWSWPIVFDPTDHLAYRYGLLGQPTTFIIDAEGRLLKSRIGIASRDEIEAEIKSARKA